ncbi:MAG: Crp/Fnr family transcriptional regulator [Deltaproteobacteria bacterium]|nr:Crp/Fnr family transcriptional regulator [Deltaproteobacteria bacterium]
MRLAEAIGRAIEHRHLELTTLAGAVRARRGQIVFHERDPADTVYLLLEGMVEALITGADPETNERPVLLLEAPAVFGDREILSETSALETMRCLTPVQLLTFPAEALLEEWTQDAGLRDRLARDLAMRYSRSLALVALQLAPLRDRILGFLLVLEGRSAIFSNPAKSLSALVGANEKTVSRMLLRLREEGAVIEADGGALRVAHEVAAGRPVDLVHTCR